MSETATPPIGDAAAMVRDVEGAGDRVRQQRRPLVMRRRSFVVSSAIAVWGDSNAAYEGGGGVQVGQAVDSYGRTSRGRSGNAE